MYIDDRSIEPLNFFRKLIITLRLATNIINIITPCSALISSKMCHMNQSFCKILDSISNVHGIPITRNSLMLITNLLKNNKLKVILNRMKSPSKFFDLLVINQKLFGRFILTSIED